MSPIWNPFGGRPRMPESHQPNCCEQQSSLERAATIAFIQTRVEEEIEKRMRDAYISSVLDRVSRDIKEKLEHDD